MRSGLVKNLKTKKCKIAFFGFILGLILSLIYYAVSWYSAGLVDQYELAEFGMEKDFVYCNTWRPDLFTISKESRVENNTYFMLEYGTYPKLLIELVSYYNYSIIIDKIIKSYSLNGHLRDRLYFWSLRSAQFCPHCSVLRRPSVS